MNEIRLAVIKDIDKIMNFININWKEKHILARDKDFFIYEHQHNNHINYVISLEDNIINGVLGFIKYSDDKSDIATVIWKALKSNDHPMLGIEIFNYLVLELMQKQ
jgi:N-acetylglutamate synthase-like GNAT family acetyltransferase